MTIWRRSATAMGMVCIAVACVLPGWSSGADVGPLATTTTTVAMSCRGVGFAAGFGTLPTQDVTFTLTAPTAVTVGQTFDLTVAVSSLVLANPGIALDAPGVTYIGVSGGTVPNAGRAIGYPIAIGGSLFTIPTATLPITPTAAAGGSVVLTALGNEIVQGSTGFGCDPVVPESRATITTQVVASLGATTTTAEPATTTTTPGQTTTTTPGQTTTTTTPGQATTTTSTTTPPATTTSTTATPTTVTTIPSTTAPPATTPPTTPAGPAVTVRSTGTASFNCNIYDDAGTKFNTNPLPASTVVATLALPDKVGVGGAVSGLVQIDPGPMNGPIKLPAGTVTFAAMVSVAGGTPTVVTATGGPNAADIAPNSPSRSPEMAFSFNAATPAGSKVDVGVSQVEVRATSPSKLTTRCLPASSMSSIGSVAVVAGTVAPPQDLAGAVAVVTNNSTSNGSRSGSSSGDGGYANCAAAKAAGRGTILKTDPAYRARLDADGDGLACEKGEVEGRLALTGASHLGWVKWSALLVALGTVLVLMGRPGRRLVPAVARRSRR